MYSLQDDTRGTRELSRTEQFITAEMDGEPEHINKSMQSSVTAHFSKTKLGVHASRSRWMNSTETGGEAVNIS